MKARLLALSLALMPNGFAPALANPLNGASARPFYVFAHNPNTVHDAEVALSNGANALEPDIALASCGNQNPLDNLVDSDPWPYSEGECSDTKLTDWLEGVHELAFQYPLALVVFDVKSSAATAENGVVILQAIRDHLNYGGINLNVIISVATRDDGAVFDNIIGPNAKLQLGEREGVQIDEEDDSKAVVTYFRGTGYNGNIAYGDGTAAFGPNLFPAMDAAAFNRAALGYPKAVTYVYTINLDDSMEVFIDAGVDGIITDDVPKLAAVVKGRSDVFLARREDNPFVPLNEAYGLRIRTADDEDDGFFDGSEGTDANITFTLEGELGTATITVDTSHAGRMEAGETNCVTIPSKNLGALKSITIYNDGTGNAPDWKLQDITVYSAKWLKPDLLYHYTARLDDWIYANSSKALPFRLDEYVWAGFASSSDGSFTSPWKQVSDAYSAVAPGGTIHLAAGFYSEKMTLAKPCTLSFWGDHGISPAQIGSP